MEKTKNEKLISWRKSRKLSQSEAAERIGITRTYYANLESGQGIPAYLLAKLDAEGYNDPNPTTFEANRRVFGEYTEITPRNSNLPMIVPISFVRMGSIHHMIDSEAMMPLLRRGDFAAFKPVTRPVALLTYIVKTDEGHIVGNLDWKDSDWTLSFLNPKVPEIVVTPSQIEGVLVNYYRDVEGHFVTEVDSTGLHIHMPPN